jgi:rhodanese-related sulfurtransferase
MSKTPQELVADARNTINLISCSDFKTMENSGAEFTLLDVREPEEFRDGHIEGAVSIPRGVLEFKIDEFVPDVGKKIVICCKTGGRATLAAQSLTQLGYLDVYVLDGGYEGYCEASSN